MACGCFWWSTRTATRSASGVVRTSQRAASTSRLGPRSVFPGAGPDEDRSCRSRGRSSWRVAVMEDHGVTVQVAERCEVADARVPRLGKKFHALCFQFGPRSADVGDADGESGFVRYE